jgi:peptidoglycan/LPS O-acetylase OafA/YrhL
MSSAPTAVAPVRYAVLDSMRGLGCLQVIIFHFFFTTAMNWLPYWFVRNTWVSLDFFFVLSGFVITYVYGDKLRDLRSALGFAVRRFGRIWPLHIIVLAALVVFIGVINLGLPHQTWMNITPTNPPFGYMPLITEFFLINSLGIWEHFYWNVPSWSMGAEFNVYIVFAAVCLVARHVLVPVAAVLSLGAIAALWRWSPEYLSADVDMGVLRCMAGYFVGVVVYRAHAAAMRLPDSRLVPRSRRAASVAEVAILSILLVFIYFLDYFGRYNPMCMISPILFGTIVYIFSFSRGVVSWALDRPVFHHLGDLSYSIYVTHWPLLIALWYVLWLVKEYLGFDVRWYFENSRMYSFFGLIAFAALVIAVSNVTYRTIEVPWRGRFAVIGRRIEGRAPRPGAAQTQTAG